MKTLRFTFEAAPTSRHCQEQQAVETYVQALLARQQILDRLETDRRQIRRNQIEMNRLFATDCAISQLARFHHYKCGLEKQQAELIVALALVERRTQAAFQTMLTARQRRETVEHFRAKRQTCQQRAERRGTQKFLHNLVSRRGHRVPAWNLAGAAT